MAPSPSHDDKVDSSAPKRDRQRPETKGWKEKGVGKRQETKADLEKQVQACFSSSWFVIGYCSYLAFRWNIFNCSSLRGVLARHWNLRITIKS